MTSYYYLDVSLELNTAKEYIITATKFKQHVMLSLNILFGEVGSSVFIQLLNYNQTERRGVLKVPEDYFIKLYGSLTLNGLYEEVECAYRVHKTTRDPLDLNLNISDSDE